jgi:crossover junction endodeoxyribonuclease RuvC
VIIAAIDPSMSRTAIVISDPAKGPEAFTVKCFSSPPEGRALYDRLRRYEDFVGRIMKHLEDHGVTHVFIEGYAYASSGSVIALAELGGILRWHLLEFAAVEVPPSSVKKFAAGSGNAKKEIVAAEISRRYNVSLASADEYDSYAIWRFARVYLEIDQPATKDQLIAVEGVKNPDAPKLKQKDVTMRQVKPRKQPMLLPPPSPDMPF